MGRRRRDIRPGVVWSIARRTTRRHFLFSPDESGEVENAFWYCLGICAEKHRILIHAACLLSTHEHVDLTDVLGRLPEFLQEFHRLMACVIKSYRGWPAEVYDKRSTGCCERLTPEAMLDGMAYIVANPVAAGAVRYARDWPGAMTLPRDLGRREIRATRPKHFFDPENRAWPEEVTLKLTLPDAVVDEYGEDQARHRVAELARDKEREAWQKAKALGLGFLGPRRVMRAKHTRRARSYEPFGERTPRFAAGGDLQAAGADIARFRSREAQYDDCLARWQRGERNVVFPHGTWWMRVHHGVPCRLPPD